MSRLKEIHDYLIFIGWKESDLKTMDKSTIQLSVEIMKYAHRNQKRENGESYTKHPIRCVQEYRDLVGIVPDDLSSFDTDLLYDNNIPLEGIQEVCLLHDVIEDSDFTIEEVQEIFYECGHESYFNKYIKQALINITHIKTMDYLSYIEICMENPISALAKMMDLQDNLHVLSLLKFDEHNYQRAAGYLQYFYMINSKYNFIETIKKYKEDRVKKAKLKANYLIMDRDGREELYIEYGDNTCVHYLKHKKQWVNGKCDLMDARVGFDESEPEDSPYRYGNGACMYDIWPITKEEAEAIVGSTIDPLKIKSET